MEKLKLLKEFGINVLYMCHLNNYICINNFSCLEDLEIKENVSNID